VISLLFRKKKNTQHKIIVMAHKFMNQLIKIHFFFLKENLTKMIC